MIEKKVRGKIDEDDVTSTHGRILKKIRDLDIDTASTYSCPTQPNLYDCGVYSLQFAEEIIANLSKCGKEWGHKTVIDAGDFCNISFDKETIKVCL